MHESETVIRHPRWVLGVVWLGFPVLGAGAVWLLKAIAGWVAGLQWAPFQGPFKLVASIGEPQASIGALAIGAVAGLVVAAMAVGDFLQVHVSPAEVRFKRGAKPERRVAREAVMGSFHDAGHLVLLGAGGAELAREKHDLERAELGKAFETHGWPWLSADPHAGQFRRFVDDDPDLPPSANAMLKARAVAVSKNDNHDLAELRDELAKLGVVVRDEKKRQYWRLVRG